MVKGGYGMFRYLGLFDILWAIWQSIIRKKENEPVDKVGITGQIPLTRREESTLVTP
jgi:hypothetical protein